MKRPHRCARRQARLVAPLPRLFLLLAAGVLFASVAQAAPANDLFANRIWLSGTDVQVTGSNAGATREAGEPIHDSLGNTQGGASVWWRWTAPDDGQVTVSTAGSDFDTLLAVYEGDAFSNLLLLGDNDDEDYPIVTTGKVVFPARRGRAYAIAVDGYDADFGNIRLRVKSQPFQQGPAWTLPDLDGRPVPSTTFAGKVVLIVFWATTCPFCQAEMPTLVSLQRRYASDGLVVVGLSIDPSAQTVKNYTNTVSGFNLTVLMDSSSTVWNMYSGLQEFGELTGTPTSFILDRQNHVLRKLEGQQEEAVFDSYLAPWLYENLQLSVARTPTQLTLRWPTNAASFILESTLGMEQPNWQPTGLSPHVEGGFHTITTPAPPSKRFYRLQMQR